jgi:hypothetical protein
MVILPTQNVFNKELDSLRFCILLLLPQIDNESYSSVMELGCFVGS